MPYKPHFPPHLDRRANYYESGPLDRAAEVRGDMEKLIERISSGSARIVPVWKSQNLVRPQEDETAEPDPVLLHGDHPILAEAETLIFLGIYQEVAHFAIDLSHHESPPLSEEGVFKDLRAFGQLIPHADGSVLAYARGLTFWHQRHRYCGVCGSPTESIQAGHVRKCTNPDCGSQHFPRTDPAVIMLVHDGGDRIIMGRQAAWPPGMHSVLAGFVEPGESLEDAVAREIFEEVGVQVTSVTYNSSQPWPFPASIMLGFTAKATTFDINVDELEIEEARWYTREELLNSPEDHTFRLPRRDSIARRLIDDWLGSDAAKVRAQQPNMPFPKVKVY